MKYLVKLNGKKYEVEVEKIGGSHANSHEIASSRATAIETPKTSQTKSVSGGEHPIITPMPGTVLDVKVSVGDSVKEGDVLFILEAMKMENEILADVSGVIKSIKAQKGATLTNGDIMAVIA